MLNAKEIRMCVVIWMIVVSLLCQASVASADFTDKPVSFTSEEAVIIIDPLRNKLSLVVRGIVFKTFPVALGKLKTPTPVGDWVIVNKYENWGSGFGTRWIGLDVPWGVYGIHGTNEPSSIGLDASHGCIRMYNGHVEELFRLVSLGTPVRIMGHALGEPGAEPRVVAAGDSGSDVMLIQSRLRSAGYYKGESDGKFGQALKEAVERFERDRGLPRDGVFGRHDYVSLGLLE
jgi:L,D-transpeptidase catalytic domain/Putative peptidoglycan binding domain